MEATALPRGGGRIKLRQSIAKSESTAPACRQSINLVLSTSTLLACDFFKFPHLSLMVRGFTKSAFWRKKLENCYQTTNIKFTASVIITFTAEASSRFQSAFRSFRFADSLT